MFRFRYLRLLLDQLKDTSSAGDRVLQFRYDTGNFIERLGVLIGVT